MKNLLFAIALGLQQPSFRRPESIDNIYFEQQSQITNEDDTERYIDILKNQGAREIRTFNSEGIAVHVYMTPQAQRIIDERNFDVPDDNFNIERFLNHIENNFSDSMEYFHDINESKTIDELNIVLESTGNDGEYTVASTRVNTRIINIDVKRWHKIYKGLKSYLSGTISIHEYTHVNNYKLDNDEVRYHRELTAIIFESLNYIRKEGSENFIDDYIERTTRPLEYMEAITSHEYRGNNPLRYLSHFFIKNVLEGGYLVSGNKIQVLERFASAYLSDTDNEDKGFNDACLNLGIKDSNNNYLTLDKVRNDLYRTIID